MTAYDRQPDFPPLLKGRAVVGDAAPFEAAIAAARAGCDAGLIFYTPDAARLELALVLTPEVALADAMAMFAAAGVGFQTAMGSIAPPEVAVHLTWDGTIRVNDASCGGLRMAADTRDSAAIPNWLIVGLGVPIWPLSDNPGENPDQTALYSEGCADIDPVELLEFWARHTLVAINHWSEEGPAPLHRDWCELVHGIGSEVTINGQSGVFQGVDERFGLLLKTGDGTILVPLETLLETDP